MELTTKDSCQAIILFDADFPQRLFEKTRNKLGLPADCKIQNRVGITVDLITFDIVGLNAILESDSELSGRFIILPHVKPKGHKTILREGFHTRFKDMPYVGGFMDRCYPGELKPGDQRILEGAIPAWGSDKRGVISTSDSRYADFHLIGKHASWLKLAAPTAESIRQAMLAPDSRIRHEEPIVPSAVIKAVTIAGSSYLADGAYLFNSQMNSLIGGRGAGKSMLLEYVRFALGRSALDEPPTVSGAATRFMELVEKTLDQRTGSVTLEISLNGADVSVTRQMAKRSVIQVTADGAETLSTVDNVRRLIQSQQFHQGELSDLALGDAEKRLLDLVTERAIGKIREIEDSLRRNSQEISESLAKAVRLSSARQARSHATTQIRLLSAQVESLKRQFATMEPEASAALSTHGNYLRQQSVFQSIKSNLDKGKAQLERALNDFIADISQSSKDQPIFDLPELGAMFAAIRMATDKDDGALNLIRAQFESWFEAQATLFEKANKEWAPYFSAHQSEYDDQKERLAGRQSLLDNIERIELQESEAAQRLEVATIEESELRDADANLEKTRRTRFDLQANLFSIVTEQVSGIETASSGLAKGELSATPDITEVCEAVRKAIELPHLREARIEEIISAVNKVTDKSAKLRELQNEMLAILKWKEGAPTEKGQPPETPILQGALDAGFMGRLYELISIERVSILLCAVIRPRINIYYLRDGGQIEFGTASQGEQAAALLNILMNQSNGPLIIDQPEEDLDNKIINEIIRTIRKAKDVRQLLLATHNANIVVNGDSENVVEMVLGRRNTGGAIDEIEVRNAITGTMEGGKEAFELRRKKYNF